MTDETLIIFELDRDLVWTGQRAEVLATDGAPGGWAIAPEPPELAEGERLRWNGEWTLLSEEHAASILERAKGLAVAELAAQRWQATRFFTYDGVRTQADAAISVVTGRLKLREVTGVTAAMKFKLADREFRSWDLAQEEAFGVAIGMHIQACFDLEDALSAQILAAEAVEDVAAIVTAAQDGWPQ